MKIEILCSSEQHPIFPYIEKWKEMNSNNHRIQLRTKLHDVEAGELLFSISFLEKIPKSIRDKFMKTLVIHASELPYGKGWSPHIWQILSGKNKFSVTLFEAVDEIDAGDIWHTEKIFLDGHELYDEINERLFEIELKLMDFAIKKFDTIKPIPQKTENYEYFQKRSPKDSELNIKKTIEEQFNLMRVADAERFPCFFYFRGKKYKLTLEKINED